MIRAGIIGLGFMGKMHFRCYQALDGVQVVAVCDTDKTKFQDTSGTAGNIEGAEAPLDFTGIELYDDFDKMLAEAKLDVLSVTLPTYMHTDHTVKALKAGVQHPLRKAHGHDGRRMPGDGRSGPGQRKTASDRPLHSLLARVRQDQGNS